MQREEQAHSPTKSERDSAVLEGLVRGEGWWCGNPSGSRQNFFGRQHLTFDKGGKGDSARQRDYCTFAMVVRIEGVDATEAIPPVAARILSGDSTSPLTREARVLAIFEG